MALARLNAFRIWLSRHRTENLMPLPVLLVEDITMALTIYSQMQTVESLSELHLFFCPDSLIMAIPPLQSLYRCEVDNDGKVTAVRTDISSLT